MEIIGRFKGKYVLQKSLHFNMTDSFVDSFLNILGI
ncbi:hypothetical protein AAKU52_002256 [Pedobacter sp. CG_S7]